MQDPQYPEVVECIDSVSKTVNALREGISKVSGDSIVPKWEFEGRLGRLDKKTGRFEAGVSHDFFQQIQRRLDMCHLWTRVTDFQSQVDYFYYIAQNIPVRTSVFYPSMTREHVHKTTQSVVDLEYTQPSGKSNGYDFRVVANMEQTLPEERMPASVDPKHVRIKSRKSYEIENRWRIDLTMSWSAATKSAAEMLQRTGNTTFEVEVECLDPASFLHSRTDAKIALSLLLKLDEFIDRRVPHKYIPFSKLRM